MKTRTGLSKRYSNGDLVDGQSERLLSMGSVPLASISRRRRILVIIIVCLITAAAFYTNFQRGTIDYRQLYASFGNVDSGCQLPQLDPFDPSIKAFVQKPEPLQCKKLQAELTYITEDGRLALNATVLELEQLTNSVNCEYRCYDKTDGLDDVTLNYSSWVQMNGVEPISFTGYTCPFIDVACSRKFPVPTPLYSNTHFRVISDRQRLEELDRLIEKVSKIESGPFSSVLLFVLDSVSRSNFVRSLPKTLAVLTESYNATVFDGFTKVGDNSLPNAMAFLTGKRVQTAGYESDLDDDMAKRFYDDWPFVWKEYAKRGYVTMYAEDYPKYNLFQYLSNGFRHRPVDHYFRPFWVHAWTSFLHLRSTHLCYGNTPKHRLQLDYLRRTLVLNADRPLFAFNWMTELGHDWMNQVGVGDDDLAEFFTKMKTYLNNTLVIVMSDHGHRFDSIRQTVIGRIEERMPFFAVSLPSAWRDTNPRQYSKVQEILARNAKVLASPFDLHATLRHFLSLTTGQNDYEAEKSNKTRGVSLFTPLPRKRQCPDAHIPEEFCVCQKEIQIANVSSDEKVQGAAATVIDHLNKLLSPLIDRCAVLRLHEIRHAQTFLPNLNAIEDGRVSIIYGGHRPTGFYVNYRVTFLTVPGEALFDSTVRYSLTDDTFSVIGDVNRINKYGNQSDCINSMLLRKFCFCMLET